jgi:hypothetical protein
MGRAASGVVLALAVGTLPASAAKVERVEVPGGSLRIEIPSTWTRVPADELELRSLFAAEATGGAASEAFEAAFRPRDAPPGDGPPVVLIQGDERGRLSWARFARLPAADDVDGLAARRLLGSGLPFADQTRLERIGFDRQRHRLAVVSRVDHTPWGPLLVTSNLYLTDAGGVAVHALSTVDSATRHPDLWASILDSVELDERLRYRPRWTDLWPWILGWPRFWFAAAAVAAVIALVILLRDRRRPRPH